MIRPINIDTLLSRTEAYADAGKLQNPLYKQLSESLAQAKHHERNGNKEQSLHHLQKYSEQLANAPMSRFITVDAQHTLLQEIEALLAFRHLSLTPVKY
ncbi:FIMAH domain-containing protein [Paenibacillus thermotolerans]|uniref:FIMAH domain-containing protein n=1 Tax=Paenibacillus thermotolerans TaxID=3027807 RepID=UPI002368C0DB|nr:MULTISPECIES: hypothetical protein [unclassified Paenibacillus]